MLCQVLGAAVVVVVVVVAVAVLAGCWHPEHVAMGFSKPPFASPLSQTMISEPASPFRLGVVSFLLRWMVRHRSGAWLLLVWLLGSWMGALGCCWYWGRARSLPRRTGVPTY